MLRDQVVISLLHRIIEHSAFLGGLSTVVVEDEGRGLAGGFH